MNNNFRKITLKSGTEILLGKDAQSNDALVKQFEGRENIILHTDAPGSPFCVIQNEKPNKREIMESGAICAGYSQDWRDNKKDVFVNVFTGKDVSKQKGMKTGTWKVNKSKKIKIKKRKIENAKTE